MMKRFAHEIFPPADTKIVSMPARRVMPPGQFNSRDIFNTVHNLRLCF